MKDNYFLFAWVKQPLHRHQHEFADAINKAGTASLCWLNKDKFSTVTD